MKAIFTTCVSLLLFFAAESYAADAAKGKAKAGMCAGCHGADGKATIPTYPHLAGQNSAYLEKQLKEFRNGTRKDPMMNALAKQLSDDDIANLAAYYAQMK